MKHNDLKPFVYCALVLVFTVHSSLAQNTHNHEAHHAESAPNKKDYVIMQSWAHQKQVLLSKETTETEADAKILDWLTTYQSMDRSAGNDRIGLQAPPFEFDD